MSIGQQDVHLKPQRKKKQPTIHFLEKRQWTSTVFQSGDSEGSMCSFQ